MITNKYGLPESLVRAVTNDNHRQHPEALSVTQLIQPHRIRIMLERHRDEIEEDITDRLFMLQGTMVHATLEAAGGTGDLVEHYMVTEFPAGLVSGTADLLTASGVLYDWKYTSVYAAKDGPKPEWVKQVNIYAAMLRREGYEPKSLNILAIFRDWSKTKAKRTRDYPQRGAQVVPVPMWPDAEVEDYVNTRLWEHTALLGTPDDQLPPCTPEERWETPAKYAVVRRGRKSAIRLLDTQEEAVRYIAERPKLASDPKVSIEYRPGESMRCQYCPIAQFCTCCHA